MRRLSIAVLLAACGASHEPPPLASLKPFAHAGAKSVVGVWKLPRPNGEEYQLTLFASGVGEFQHVGPKLPISRAVGHFTFDGSTLRFDKMKHEPDERSFPLASEMAVTLESPTSLVLANESWRAVDAPYGVDPGAEERAAKDESNAVYWLAQ